MRGAPTRCVSAASCSPLTGSECPAPSLFLFTSLSVPAHLSHPPRINPPPHLQPAALACLRARHLVCRTWLESQRVRGRQQRKPTHVICESLNSSHSLCEGGESIWCMWGVWGGGRTEGHGGTEPIVRGTRQCHCKEKPYEKVTEDRNPPLSLPRKTPLRK